MRGSWLYSRGGKRKQKVWSRILPPRGRRISTPSKTQMAVRLVEASLIFFTFGLFGFGAKAKAKAARAKQEFEDYKQNFDKKYGDVGTPAFETEKLNVDKAMNLAWQKKEHSKRERQLCEQNLQETCTMLAEHEKVKQKHQQAIQGKLSSTGSANVKSFVAITMAVRNLSKQKESLAQNYNIFAVNLTKQCDAYHGVVKAFAKADAAGRQRFLTQIGNAGGWHIACPGITYAQKRLAAVLPLLTKDFPDGKIPELNTMLNDFTTIAKAEVDALGSTGKPEMMLTPILTQAVQPSSPPEEDFTKRLTEQAKGPENKTEEPKAVAHPDPYVEAEDLWGWG